LDASPPFSNFNKVANSKERTDMNDKEIKEMWETLTNRRTVPKGLMATINALRRYMGVFGPKPLSVSEVAICMVIFQMVNVLKEGAPDSKKEETADGE
jgi:hypothetical protein